MFPSTLANPINKLVLRTRLFIGFTTLSGNLEIFSSRLANPINKLVLRTRLFIGFTTLSREIFPVSESQCELITISKSYELMVLALCVLSNVGQYLYGVYENILKSFKVIKRTGPCLQWYRLEIS